MKQRPYKPFGDEVLRAVKIIRHIQEVMNCFRKAGIDVTDKDPENTVGIHLNAAMDQAVGIITRDMTLRKGTFKDRDCEELLHRIEDLPPTPGYDQIYDVLDYFM